MWRLIGTGLSFVVFGLGGILTGLVIFPLSFIFVRDAQVRQRFARGAIGCGFALFVWMMKSLGVLSYSISGLERRALSAGRIVVANHPTLIDVVFLVSLFPQSVCVVKEAVMRNPFMSFTVKAANYISNVAPDQLLGECVKRVCNGESLLLFPEGTRSVQGRPMTFKPGAASVAVDADAELLPVVIACQPPTLSKHEPWHRIPPRRPHFTLDIQPPLRIQDLVDNTNSARDTRKELNLALLQWFNKRAPDTQNQPQID